MLVGQAHRVVMRRDERALLRESSLDVAARVLRASGRYADALFMDRVEPAAIEGAPRGAACRAAEVNALVMNEGARERSTRRSMLRYAALRVRDEDGPESAAIFLERVALDDSPGSYVSTGQISAVAELRAPSSLDEFPFSYDEDEGEEDQGCEPFGDDEDAGAERTMFLRRVVIG